MRTGRTTMTDEQIQLVINALVAKGSTKKSTDDWKPLIAKLQDQPFTEYGVYFAIQQAGGAGLSKKNLGFDSYSDAHAAIDLKSHRPLASQLKSLKLHLQAMAPPTEIQADKIIAAVKALPEFKSSDTSDAKLLLFKDWLRSNNYTVTGLGIAFDQASDELKAVGFASGMSVLTALGLHNATTGYSNKIDDLDAHFDRIITPDVKATTGPTTTTTTTSPTGPTSTTTTTTTSHITIYPGNALNDATDAINDQKDVGVLTTLKGALETKPSTPSDVPTMKAALSAIFNNEAALDVLVAEDYTTLAGVVDARIDELNRLHVDALNDAKAALNSASEVDLRSLVDDTGELMTRYVNGPKFSAIFIDVSKRALLRPDDSTELLRVANAKIAELEAAEAAAAAALAAAARVAADAKHVADLADLNDAKAAILAENKDRPKLKAALDGLGIGDFKGMNVIFPGADTKLAGDSRELKTALGDQIHDIDLKDAKNAIDACTNLGRLNTASEGLEAKSPSKAEMAAALGDIYDIGSSSLKDADVVQVKNFVDARLAAVEIEYKNFFAKSEIAAIHEIQAIFEGPPGPGDIKKAFLQHLAEGKTVDEKEIAAAKLVGSAGNMRGAFARAFGGSIITPEALDAAGLDTDDGDVAKRLRGQAVYQQFLTSYPLLEAVFKNTDIRNAFINYSGTGVGGVYIPGGALSTLMEELSVATNADAAATALEKAFLPTRITKAQFEGVIDGTVLNNLKEDAKKRLGANRFDALITRHDIVAMPELKKIFEDGDVKGDLITHFATNPAPDEKAIDALRDKLKVLVVASGGDAALNAFAAAFLGIVEAGFKTHLGTAGVANSAPRLGTLIGEAKAQADALEKFDNFIALPEVESQTVIVDILKANKLAYVNYWKTRPTPTPEGFKDLLDRIETAPNALAMSVVLATDLPPLKSADFKTAHIDGTHAKVAELRGQARFQIFFDREDVKDIPQLKEIFKNDPPRGDLIAILGDANNKLPEAKIEAFVNNLAAKTTGAEAVTLLKNLFTFDGPPPINIDEKKFADAEVADSKDNFTKLLDQVRTKRGEKQYEEFKTSSYYASAGAELKAVFADAEAKKALVANWGKPPAVYPDATAFKTFRETLAGISDLKEMGGAFEAVFTTNILVDAKKDSDNKAKGEILGETRYDLFRETPAIAALLPLKTFLEDTKVSPALKTLWGDPAKKIPDSSAISTLVSTFGTLDGKTDETKLKDAFKTALGGSTALDGLGPELKLIASDLRGHSQYNGFITTAKAELKDMPYLLGYFELPAVKTELVNLWKDPTKAAPLDTTKLVANLADGKNNTPAFIRKVFTDEVGLDNAFLEKAFSDGPIHSDNIRRARGEARFHLFVERSDVKAMPTLLPVLDKLRTDLEAKWGVAVTPPSPADIKAFEGEIKSLDPSDINYLPTAQDYFKGRFGLDPATDVTPAGFNQALLENLRADFIIKALDPGALQDFLKEPTKRRAIDTYVATLGGTASASDLIEKLTKATSKSEVETAMKGLGLAGEVDAVKKDILEDNRKRETDKVGGLTVKDCMTDKDLYTRMEILKHNLVGVTKKADGTSKDRYESYFDQVQEILDTSALTPSTTVLEKHDGILHRAIVDLETLIKVREAMLSVIDGTAPRGFIACNEFTQVLAATEKNAKANLISKQKRDAYIHPANALFGSDPDATQINAEQKRMVETTLDDLRERLAEAKKLQSEVQASLSLSTPTHFKHLTLGKTVSVTEVDMATIRNSDRKVEAKNISDAINKIITRGPGAIEPEAKSLMTMSTGPEKRAVTTTTRDTTGIYAIHTEIARSGKMADPSDSAGVRQIPRNDKVSTGIKREYDKAAKRAKIDFYVDPEDLKEFDKIKTSSHKLRTPPPQKIMEWAAENTAMLLEVVDRSNPYKKPNIRISEGKLPAHLVEAIIIYCEYRSKKDGNFTYSPPLGWKKLAFFDTKVANFKAEWEKTHKIESDKVVVDKIEEGVTNGKSPTPP